MCSACMYAKATKNPWRGKQNLTYEPKVITEPRELVSVDQLFSPNPGFIVQMTGYLTTKKYKYATIFVDQASKLGYLYMQKTNNWFKQLKPKQPSRNTAWIEV